VVVTPLAGLAISKTASASSVSAGNTMSFTLVLSNTTGSTVTGASFKDNLPTGLASSVTSVVSSASSGASTSSFAMSTSAVSGSVTIPVGGTVTVTLQLTLASGISGAYTNTATLALPSGVGGTATVTATASISVVNQASDMGASWSGFASPAALGSTVNGTVQYVNLSANTATLAMFNLALSPGLSGVSISSAVLGSGTYNQTTGTVSFALSSLSSVTAGYTVSVAVSYTQGASTVLGTATTGASNDSNANNNTATLSVASNLTLDLSAALAASTSSTTTGGTVNYVLVLRNAGPAMATYAPFGVSLPSGLTLTAWLSSSAGTGASVNSLTTSSSTISGSLTLASGAAVTLTYQVQVGSAASGTLTTTATIAAPTGLTESNTSNNLATASLVVTGPAVADLVSAISVTASSTPGYTVSAVVTVSNNGPSTAQNVTVTLTLPSTSSTRVITVPSLPAGSSTVTTVYYKVPLSQSAALNWTATALTTTLESNTANNVVTAVTAMAQIKTASLSGRAWLDVNSDKTYTQGTDTPLVGWTVELLLNSVVVGSATTGSDGKYLIQNMLPGTTYQVQFKTPAGLAVVNTPYNQSSQTQNGNQSTGTTQSMLSNASGQVIANNITQVSLYLGDNTLDQNLPVDPSGVVYDSVTRKPIAGAVVTLYGPDGAQVDPKWVLQAATQITTDASGVYQFDLLAGAPDGTYRLQVDPPAQGYAVSPALLGGVGKPQGVLTPPTGQAYVLIQPNAAPPGAAVTGVAALGSVGTQYYLQFKLTLSGGVSVQSAGVLHNHIPLDPLVAGSILVSKTGDKTVAEVGDSLRYVINIRNTTNITIPGVTLEDFMPAGFRLIAGTARLNGAAMAEPSGGVGPNLVFAIGNLPANTNYELAYSVRLGVGSQQGTGINKAQAVFIGSTGRVVSNLATFKTTVQGGVLGNEGCIVGKVYLDCDGDGVQSNVGGSNELGIPGVRLVLLDGSYVITDSEGKYSLCGVQPQTHVVKVDNTTMPKGSRLVPSSNRNAGVGSSLFVDLKGGELARADFIEGSCSPEVLDQVKARRTQGAVVAPLVAPVSPAPAPAASGASPVSPAGVGAVTEPPRASEARP